MSFRKRERQFENPPISFIAKPEKLEGEKPCKGKKKSPVEEMEISEEKKIATFENDLESQQIRGELKKLQEIELRKKEEPQFFKEELLKKEKEEEKEPKQIYVDEMLKTVKDRLSQYLPHLYRENSTKLDYQDQAKELRIKYSFHKEKITIETPENLSNKNLEDLKKAKIDFLVFKKFAGEEKISKKIQDFFFLTHEYAHGINQSLIREFHPTPNLKERAKLVFASSMHRNDLKGILILGEGFPISIERIVTEKMLEDPTINEDDKKEIRLFWEKHQESLASKKLEKSPESKYTELDETMIYYKIYQAVGEGGILDFIKNCDSEKLSRIKKYSNLKERILSSDYKKFLEMDGEELVKTFTKEKLEKI